MLRRPVGYVPPPKATPIIKKGKKKKKRAKVDMLDSWARYPGSFGSGKR